MKKNPQESLMQTNHTLSQPRRVIFYSMLVLAGIWIGSVIGHPPMADAGVRKGKEPVAFKSGGERSEAVLRDIAVILNRMDGRISTIEEILVKAANTHP